MFEKIKGSKNKYDFREVAPLFANEVMYVNASKTASTIGGGALDVKGYTKYYGRSMGVCNGVIDPGFREFIIHSQTG